MPAFHGRSLWQFILVSTLCGVAAGQVLAFDNEGQRMAADNFNGGLQALRSSQYSQARKSLTEAVTRDPCALYSGYLALACFKLKDFASAKAYADLAIRQNNDAYLGHYVLGLVLDERKEFSGAFKELKLGSRLAAKDGLERQDFLKFARLHTNVGKPVDLAYENRVAEIRNLVRANRWSQAFALTEVAMQSDPNDADIRYMRGTIFEATDRMAEARREFAVAIKLGSNQAILGMAQLYLAENKKAEAIPYLKECIRTDTNVTDALKLLVGCLLEQNAIPEALLACDKLVLMEPHKPGSYLTRANCYLKAKRYQNAIEDCTTGIRYTERSSLLSGVYRERAKAYQLSGQPKLAEQDLAQARAVSAQWLQQRQPRIS